MQQTKCSSRFKYLTGANITRVVFSGKTCPLNPANINLITITWSCPAKIHRRALCIGVFKVIPSVLRRHMR